uniref:FLYWCH-type domain-containing protein n=1 Tax=Panagrolaimus sp. PS1159 TaxID=55785 RepID=A0AC35G2H3_9BILA
MDAMSLEEEDTFAINDPIKVTDTRLKKPIAQIGGYKYKYSHASKSTGVCYWRCTKYQKGKCLAVIYTDSITDGSLVCQMKYKHIGDAIALERRNIRSATHQIIAENPNLPTRYIIAQVTDAASDALKTAGVGENLARVIRHRRQKACIELPAPTTWSFDIPVIFLTNIDGSPFILFDSATTSDIPDGRIIILGSRESLEMLALANQVVGDGSDSRLPAGFMQIWSLHAQRGQTFKPCFHFLMTQRTIPYFDYAFIKLKEIVPQFSPTSITMDFDRAVIASIQKSFPDIIIDGSICNEIRTKFGDQLDAFLDFFEDTFIGRPNVEGGRREPRIPISHWNVYQRVASNLLTSDSLETWHRVLINSLKSENPSIWSLFEALKKDFTLFIVRETDQTATQIPKCF